MQHINSSAPLITMANAGLCKDQRWLVRGIDLTLEKGEILTLIGPNGSGKSSTVKMALGIEKPSEGSVKKRNGICVSYVPQHVHIDWTLPLNVRRFMVLTAQLKADSIERALAATNTLHLANQEVRSLSGGEFQRVLLARAMARTPDLLVLDEPVQGVDFKGEIDLYQLIQQIRDDLKCGVLLISHDLHVVMAATDRVLCLNGHVCCSGTPMSVASSKEYQALFGTHAVDGLALYQHHNQHTDASDHPINASKNTREKNNAR